MIFPGNSSGILQRRHSGILLAKSLSGKLRFRQVTELGCSSGEIREVIMKGWRCLILMLAVLAVTAGSSAADVTIDMKPTHVRFREEIIDEFDMTRVQGVVITIANVGNHEIYDRRPLKVSISGIVTEGRIASKNGYEGGPIPVRQDGVILARLPVRSIRHCQRVTVVIDLERDHQLGPGVYANDKQTLVAVDQNSRVLCNIVPRPSLWDPLDLWPNSPAEAMDDSD